MKITEYDFTCQFVRSSEWFCSLFAIKSGFPKKNDFPENINSNDINIKRNLGNKIIQSLIINYYKI